MKIGKKFRLYPSVNDYFCSRLRHAKKITAGICFNIPRIHPPQEDYFLSIIPEK
jgi:hypothetical protein